MGFRSSHVYSGSKNGAPFQSQNSQPANHQTDALFTSERSNMDYMTLNGACNRTGATEEELMVFLLKEIIDNGMDFIEANTPSSSSSNNASDDAQPVIYVDKKYDQDKMAPAVISSNVEIWMHKTWGVTDFGA